MASSPLSFQLLLLTSCYWLDCRKMGKYIPEKNSKLCREEDCTTLWYLNFELGGSGFSFQVQNLNLEVVVFPSKLNLEVVVFPLNFWNTTLIWQFFCIKVSILNFSKECHYLQKKVGVVNFTKARRLVKFQSPRALGL